MKKVITLSLISLACVIFFIPRVKEVKATDCGSSPTTPTAIHVTNGLVTSTSITLNWSAALDDQMVTRYRIIRNGIYNPSGIIDGTPAATTFTDIGLTPGTSYTYNVVAYDACGNQSGQPLTPAATTTLADTLSPREGIPISIPSAPDYGYTLVSNSAGRYIATATSSLGLASLGLVTVYHVTGGSPTPYNAAANTDSARGTALLSACSALSSGDIIYVASSTYDMGSSNCDLSKGGTISTSLIGSGKYSTVIKSSILSVSGTNSCIIDVSSTTASIVSDISILGTASGSNQCPVGTISTNVNNFSLRNVYIRGESDGVMIAPVAASVGTSTAKIFNLTTSSNWDSVLFRVATGTLDVYDSDLVSAASSSALAAGSNQTMHGIVNQGTTKGQSAIVNIYNTKLSATGGSVADVAIQVLSVGGVYPPTNFYSGSTTSSGTGLLDISGPASVDSAAVYNPTKTSGTITHLDTDQIAYSLAGGYSTSGKILKTTGSAAQWVTPASLGLSACGNAGYVQFNDGSGGFTCDSFFTYDTGSNFLGVGQASPSYTLDVGGTIGNSDTGDYLIAANGADSFFNLNGGNVGIGTPSPRGIFDIIGTASTISKPSLASSTIVYGAGDSNLQNCGGTYQYKILAYKMIGTRKVVSAATTTTAVSDNGLCTQDIYVNVTWSAVAGATGYYVEEYNTQFVMNFDYYVDVGNVLVYQDGNGGENGLTAPIPTFDTSVYPSLYVTSNSGDLFSSSSIITTRYLSVASTSPTNPLTVEGTSYLNGNVGIKSAPDPTYALKVYSSIVIGDGNDSSGLKIIGTDGTTILRTFDPTNVGATNSINFGAIAGTGDLRAHGKKFHVLDNSGGNEILMADPTTLHAVGIATTTPDSTLDVYGTVRFEGTSAFTTSSISGAIVGIGCDTADKTGLTGLASTTAFVTTPQVNPGAGVFFYTLALTSTSARTYVCSDVTVTPNASTYNVRIIR